MAKVIEDACQIKKGSLVKTALIAVESTDYDELLHPDIHETIKEFLDEKKWNAGWTGHYSVTLSKEEPATYRALYEYMFKD